MNTQKFIEAQLGIKTNRQEYYVTVGTSPDTILPNNPNRISWFISNLQGQTVYVSDQPNVSTTTGAFLGVGAALSSGWHQDGLSVTNPVYGISSATGTKLYVLETVIIQ